MEADLAKVRKLMKEADACEEVLNQLPLSEADKVEKFREVLSKIWEPRKEIPRSSELDELMDTLNMQKQDQQENIRILAGELQKKIHNCTGRTGTRPVDARPLEHAAQGILRTTGRGVDAVPGTIKIAGDLETDQGGGHPQVRRGRGMESGNDSHRQETRRLDRRLGSPKKLLAGSGTGRRQKFTPDSRKPRREQG